MTNAVVPLLFIFLIKYIAAITVYLYGLHLVIYFCTDKAILHHRLAIQKNQAVIIPSCLFLRQRLTLVRLVTPMKIVHTDQKYWFRLLQILRKYNSLKLAVFLKVCITKGSARTTFLLNENLEFWNKV